MNDTHGTSSVLQERQRTSGDRVTQNVNDHEDYLLRFSPE